MRGGPQIQTALPHRLSSPSFFTVIPAQAGIYIRTRRSPLFEIPACAGMTTVADMLYSGAGRSPVLWVPPFPTSQA